VGSGGVGGGDEVYGMRIVTQEKGSEPKNKASLWLLAPDQQARSMELKISLESCTSQKDTH